MCDQFTPQFLNAKELHEANPDTFEWAGLEVLKVAVKAGCYVKVCETSGRTAERFWVRVDEIQGDQIEGVVWNNLVYSPLEHGDEISFSYENIYDFYYTDDPGTGDEQANIRGVHATCN